MENTTLWNVAFTSMIRQTQQAAWGNWTLNPAIKPGMVGILEADKGSFTPITTIPKGDIVSMAASEEWNLESSSVHESQAEIEFKGGYHDPSSGTDVNVGLKTSWSFSEKGSIVSKGTLVGRSSLNDFGTLMREQFPWLRNQAESVGYTTPKGIVQGFGVITHVTQSISGLNVGSLNEASTFAISGSVDGVTAMTGGGTVTAGIKGSYKEVNESNAFERHLWPSSANTVAMDPIGITYQFASFDGELIMPTWTGPLSGFSITFDNAHGGTYIGDCSVTYDTPSAPGQTKRADGISGGISRTITGIPLDATNMIVVVDFRAGDRFEFKWARPLSTWLTGQQTIDMWGVWPWASHAAIREPKDIRTENIRVAY